jgi:hypothetical protein
MFPALSAFSLNQMFCLHDPERPETKFISAHRRAAADTSAGADTKGKKESNLAFQRTST